MTYDNILERMRMRYRELAGFDADQASDIGIRLKVLAAETAELYEKMIALQNEVFPQTSSGKYLDMHAETKAVTRKPAVAAQGILRFSRETPALTDIPIPAGILCATRPQPQVHFETTQDATLLAGNLYVDVPARAVDAGDLGNVAAKAACVMVSPPSGVSGVSNPEPFNGGINEETDDALRARLLAAYRNISNGTNSAFYYDLAMSCDGVSSANVLPRKRGRGTVDVVVAYRSGDAETEIVKALQSGMDSRKEINVDVLVRAAVRDNTAVTAEIAVKDGYNYELVAEKSLNEIYALLSGRAVGESLLLAELGKRLLSVDGVYNYRIVAPAMDVIPASDHVLRPGAVTINRMAVG